MFQIIFPKYKGVNWTNYSFIKRIQYIHEHLSVSDDEAEVEDGVNGDEDPTTNYTTGTVWHLLYWLTAVKETIYL